MSSYVPAHCHGSALAFSTFAMSHVHMPGFIEGVWASALQGALVSRGLEPSDTASADVMVQSTFELIDRNPPRQPRDPFGEVVATSELNRFVTHVVIRIVDQRTQQLIWTGSVDRTHAIQGNETFHNDRAVLLITQILDDMFVGLTTPCE